MSAKQAYKALVPNLAECLSALEEDEYLIVARKHTNVYVQFAGQGWHGMRAEAVSNAHILPLTTLLTVKQYEAMLRLGWQRPTSLPEESDSDGRTPRDVDGSCNFFVDVPRDGDLRVLARMAVRTLRDVYHVTHPGHLEYHAFSSDGTGLRFPTLQIKRRRAEAMDAMVGR